VLKKVDAENVKLLVNQLAKLLVRLQIKSAKDSKALPQKCSINWIWLHANVTLRNKMPRNPIDRAFLFFDPWDMAKGK